MSRLTTTTAAVLEFAMAQSDWIETWPAGPDLRAQMTARLECAFFFNCRPCIPDPSLRATGPRSTATMPSPTAARHPPVLPRYRPPGPAPSASGAHHTLAVVWTGVGCPEESLFLSDLLWMYTRLVHVCQWDTAGSTTMMLVQTQLWPTDVPRCKVWRVCRLQRTTPACSISCSVSTGC